MTSTDNAVGVVVTGLAWTGGGTRSIDAALRELVETAKVQLDLTAFSVTSGADQLFAVIEARLEAGVTVRLVVNQLTHPSKAQTLIRVMGLVERYPNRFKLWDFPQQEDGDMAGLHAKLLIADRSRAFIGSANLSFLGLAASHELGVVIDGPAAQRVARCFDRLVNSQYVRAITSATEGLT